ncbi:MAG TPA: hypothetical protein VK716_08315 [Terracidiphilus sp.]|jgi:hypothetical protein|nr:hypothetical protein [Terracidiphilus sp.]
MAYEFENELEDEFEEELEDEMEGELEGEEFLGNLLGEGEGFLGDLLGESEDFLGEGEDEGEDEYEAGLNPIRKIYPDAMMEHLGVLAAESESEDEAAEHFLPLIGMAASKLLPVVARAIAPAAKRALPRVAKALTKATPRLTKGIGQVAKVLHRNPKTRHLLRVVPGIARRTVGTLAHKAARGGRIAPATAVRTLARQARRVLGNPRQRTQALRRHHLLERKFHRRHGHGVARPHGPYGVYRGGVRRWRGGIPGAQGTRGFSGVHRTGASGKAHLGSTRGGGGCQCSGCCSCCGRPLR